MIVIYSNIKCALTGYIIHKTREKKGVSVDSWEFWQERWPHTEHAGISSSTTPGQAMTNTLHYPHTVLQRTPFLHPNKLTQMPLGRPPGFSGISPSCRPRAQTSPRLHGNSSDRAYGGSGGTNSCKTSAIAEMWLERGWVTWLLGGRCCADSVGSDLRVCRLKICI